VDPEFTDDTFFEVYQNSIQRGFTGSILVRHKGEILMDEAAGLANRENNIPNTPDTVSTMGSITKQFTGALILKLQEAGLVSVEDRLIDYFPDVPADKADITIHQLLTHSAGFPGGLGPDEDPIERDAYLSLAWSTNLLFEPGTSFRYSNTGYSIAAAIIEVITAQSYEVVLNEQLLVPASLNETGYVLPDWSNRVLATGYNGSSAVESIRPPWAADGPYWNLRGNGGLLTTTKDLLKWHDALEPGVVLSAESIDAFQGRQVAENSDGDFYGYGWSIVETPAGDLITHNGSNNHHFASVHRFIDEDLVIIMLSNELNNASIRLPLQLARSLVPELSLWIN